MGIKRNKRDRKEKGREKNLKEKTHPF